MHFNQEARAKPLEHIIFILDFTVSRNINRFIVLTFYHSHYRKYGPFWEISCGADIERWWKYRTEKKYTILLRKRIKELRSVFLFNAVRPELHLSQTKPLITRSCFWTLLLFSLDYCLLSVVCEKLCPLFGSCIKLWQKGRYLVCAGSGPVIEYLRQICTKNVLKSK